MTEAQPAKAFLGVGWKYPVSVADDGSTALAFYELDVEQAILIILGTDSGERVMRPDFGAGLKSFVFGPINQITLRSIQSRVEESLIKWEPRIDVLQVKVASDPGQLTITITYRIRVTNTVHNLVYPYYLDEGAAP